jgi:hypothetical protein
VPSGRRVDPTSAVNDYVAHAKLDPAAHVVGAEAWLPRTKIDDSTEQIVEQSDVVPEAKACSRCRGSRHRSACAQISRASMIESRIPAPSTVTLV